LERFQNPVDKSEKKAKSIPLSQLYHCTLSWLCTGTSIQNGGVKLVLWDQRFPLNKMIGSCKCFPHVSKILILKYKRENSVSVKILNIMHINVQDNNYYAYLLYIYLYLKSLNNLHKNLYINFQALRPCGLPQRKFITYMKNKQHDVTKEIKEFITLISRNFVYEKSMSIQFCV
jgi:hypothetical protein